MSTSDRPSAGGSVPRQSSAADDAAPAALSLPHDERLALARKLLAEGTSTAPAPAGERTSFRRTTTQRAAEERRTTESITAGENDGPPTGSTGRPARSDNAPSAKRRSARSTRGRDAAASDSEDFLEDGDRSNARSRPGSIRRAAAYVDPWDEPSSDDLQAPDKRPARKPQRSTGPDRESAGARRDEGPVRRRAQAQPGEGFVDPGSAVQPREGSIRRDDRAQPREGFVRRDREARRREDSAYWGDDGARSEQQDVRTSARRGVRDADLTNPWGDDDVQIARTFEAQAEDRLAEARAFADDEPFPGNRPFHRKSTEPEVTSGESDAGGGEPDAGPDEPDAEADEPRVGSAEPETTSAEIEARSAASPPARSTEPAVRSAESAVRSAESAVRSAESAGTAAGPRATVVELGVTPVDESWDASAGVGVGRPSGDSEWESSSSLGGERGDARRTASDDVDPWAELDPSRTAAADARSADGRGGSSAGRGRSAGGGGGSSGGARDRAVGSALDPWADSDDAAVDGSSSSPPRADARRSRDVGSGAGELSYGSAEDKPGRAPEAVRRTPVDQPTSRGDRAATEEEAGAGRRGGRRASGRRVGGGFGRRKSRTGDEPEFDPGVDQEADPYSVARTILLDKLTGQPRTRAELADVLAEREIPDEVADEVLDRFTDVGLIDDAAFANAWVESRHRGRGLGKRALAQELRRRGVDDELARDALEELDPEQEEQTARELVRRKLRPMRSLDRQVAMRRLLGMLARKGYPGGLAMTIVKQELDADHDEFPLIDSSGLGPE